MSAPGMLDLAGIRARAEAAKVYINSPWGVFVSVEVIEAPDEGPSDEEVEVTVNKYIAGMDPPTTLALVDEVERLTRERDEAREYATMWANRTTSEMGETAIEATRADEAEAEAAKLRARVAELEGALGPFAAEAKGWADDILDIRMFYTRGDWSAGDRLTIGDFRRAAAALAETRGGDAP